MKTLIACLCLISSSLLFAQPLTSPGEGKPLTLSERYQQMKAGAETYAEYKVIKENLLDKTWKIVNDSMNASRSALRNANAEIIRLEGELANIQAAWKVKEESIKDLEAAGTHISFIGIDFGKKTFISFNLILIAGLLTFYGLLILKLKNLIETQREKTELLNVLSMEFETYKHKALEKQTKISRELQNERNRVMELRKV